MSVATIDTALFGAIDESNNSPCVAFVSQNTGYAFMTENVAGASRFGYRKTTDGGLTWGSFVQISADVTFGHSVWFDQWTKDDAGTKIHFVYLDTTNDDLHYGNIETTTDTLTEVVVNAAIGNAAANSQFSSITKTTNGHLFCSGGHNVFQIYKSIDGGATWANTSFPTGLQVKDEFCLLPMTDGNMMAVWLDDSATTLKSNIYNTGTNAWGTDVSIDTAFQKVDTNGNTRRAWGACVNNITGKICAIGGNRPNNAANDIKAYLYSGGSWTTKTDVFTDIGTDINGADPAIDLNGNLYAIYARGASGSERVYFKESTDDGVTWGSQIELSASTFTGKTVRVSHWPYRITAVWYDTALNDMIFETRVYGVNVNDAVSIAENVNLGTDILKVNVGENSAITEAVSSYLDVLVVVVLEPFNVTITEHYDIIDLIVEVGIVEDSINPIEDISIFIDVLHVSVNDLVTASEDTSLSLDVLNIDSGDIYDSIIVLDLQLLNTDIIYESVNDYVSVVTFKDISLDALFVDANSNVAVSEDDSVYFDVLNVDVEDTLAVTDFSEQFLPELVVDSYDDITISEFANQGREILEADVSDNLSIAEDLEIVFQILLVDVWEDVFIVEDAFLQLDQLFLFVLDVDDILVTDLAQLIDGLKFIGPVRELVLIQEVVSLYPLSLHPFGPDKPTGLVGQYKVEDYAELYIPINAGIVDDVVGVTDLIDGGGTTAWLEVLITISVFDFVSVTEDRTIVRDPEIRAGIDNISFTEFAEAQPDNLFTSVFDAATATDAGVASTDPLYMEAFDLASVTEFLKMTDIVVELGPVWEDIGPVTELQVIIQIFAPLLNINVHDNIAWVGGLIAAGLDPFDLAVSDAVTIAENFGGLDEAMDVFAFDSVTVSEFKNIPSPFHYDDIIFDVFDNVSVAEDQTTLMPILRPGVFDAIVVSEDFDVDTGNNNLSRFDSVNIQEQVTIDREILINVYDAVAVVERLVARDSLYQDTPILFQFKTRVRIFTSDQINTTGVLIP